MKKQFILASNNKGKLQELKEKLEPFGIELISQEQAGINLEVNETGTTYSENAILKAKAIFELTHKPVISDDSGLEIDFLGGKPGIYSARFLPKNTNYEKCEKILEFLEIAKENERGARFKCSICFIDEKGEIHLFEQECIGKIAYLPKGTNGFGYDPIFEYNGKTFAQMDASEKNKVSHRGKAVEEFMKYIKNNI